MAACTKELGMLLGGMGYSNKYITFCLKDLKIDIPKIDIRVIYIPFRQNNAGNDLGRPCTMSPFELLLLFFFEAKFC